MAENNGLAELVREIGKRTTRAEELRTRVKRLNIKEFKNKKKVLAKIQEIGEYIQAELISSTKDYTSATRTQVDALKRELDKSILFVDGELDEIEKSLPKGS